MTQPTLDFTECPEPPKLKEFIYAENWNAYKRLDDRAGQSAKILDYLKAGNRITPLEALDLFGCFRLGGRIYDLKKQGYKIADEWVDLPSGKRVKRYFLR